MVVCVCSRELGRSRSPAAGAVGAGEDESHRGPESESGDGIDLGGAVGTMVASVLVEETLESDAAADLGVGCSDVGTM